MAVYRHMSNYTLSDVCAEHYWGSNNRWFRIVPIDNFFFKRVIHIFYANLCLVLYDMFVLDEPDYETIKEHFE